MDVEKRVEAEMKRGWIGSRTKCKYHPCHFKGQDCTFCFCPFYPCGDPRLGREIESKKGEKVWECTFCLFIHRREVGMFAMSEIKRLGIESPRDPRLRGVFQSAVERFFRPGKALMVLGATSDAGKSVTVAAICRILHRRGYLATPFKSQNMSLNSKVTPKGSEIAMIQTVQSAAAGLKNPDQFMNPILLKPKGDTVSQVMVMGAPFGDYGVEEYYGEFVPGPGTRIVGETLRFLKDRYDFVVMEGAGSPAEINIYDRDIANMGAAKIAGAGCVLVVNVEWGGSFAYAVGTVMLIPEEDRKMIKGVILNNVRGSTAGVRAGAAELERILGIPVIGVIPHVDVFLPSEDSEAFRGMTSRGTGRTQVSVVKLPRIANFTDLDPLYMEDVTVRFVSDPKGLEGSDAIIIPGTKNTIDDLAWMRESGFAEAVSAMAGKVPILGICGGYQMMGAALRDPQGIEGRSPSEAAGLGLFDMETEWSEYKKKVIQDRGVLLETGEPVSGYEIHMGLSEVRDPPLFRIERYSGDETEGSFIRERMLFGTYLHGVFDKPAFRKFFLSFAEPGGGPAARAEPRDFDDAIEESIDRLADAFEENMDVDALIRIAEGGE
ncbi:MAG: cobyric acid synthase [Candidatus Methanoplasma sp.]|jgi:adenosylcobyric acid synthase|nr:cobyric acid synthase [Candidatus Methanoplasma sp.]